ncbi:hypothetical protein [Paenibacillus kribbensis]|uniref:hypothetical protein n=1 Tax=Paenibacillus kribbensis TaxID=172713 RepID=UPI00159F1B6D|nr:hypothetical protein [Paenibacillus kribbensis]
MRIVDYIKDRLLFLIMNILIFVVLCWMLMLFRVGSGLIAVIGCILDFEEAGAGRRGSS